MAYELEIENFTGPLDLLYQLIKEREIEINEISLARVADQYMAHLHRREDFDMDSASQFTRIGAELLELKVKSLLPGGDEEGEDDQAESPLVARLKEHKLIRDLCQELAGCREEAALEYFSRHLGCEREDQIDLEIDAGCDRLKELMDQVLENYERRQERDERRRQVVDLVRESVSLQEKMEDILSALEEAGSGESFSFSDFIENPQNRLEVAATLLSLLELSLQEKISLRQEKPFGEIEIIPSAYRQNEVQ